MCRFVLYLGEPLTIDCLTTRPRHSLIHQSYKARERKEPLNGDGFGLAWYTPRLSPRPALFRSTTPAWNNANLRELARVTESHCIMAHVRAATPPLPVTELNCHPFSAGRIALMHNGFIPGFTALRRGLTQSLNDEAFAAIRGNTDSEHILAMLIDRLERDDDIDHIADALAATLHAVNELVAAAGGDRPARLNVAVSNGSGAVVSRVCLAPELSDSLYLHQGKKYVCEGDRCAMVAPDQGRGAVIVASEPLSQDPGWEPVPANHLVVVRPDQSVSLRPLAVA